MSVYGQSSWIGLEASEMSHKRTQCGKGRNELAELVRPKSMYHLGGGGAFKCVAFPSWISERALLEIDWERIDSQGSQAPALDIYI